jgi:hypothetical protein
VLTADLNFLSSKSSRISSFPSIILGSAGIPVPFAIRSFLEKVPAIIDAAATAAGPRVLTNDSLALSSFSRSGLRIASEKSSNSEPPGRLISN